MKRKEQIEKKVQQTLNVLEGIEPDGTDDFFYSRLRARMDTQSQPEAHVAASPAGEWSFGLTAGFATVLLIISINLMFLANLHDQPADYEAAERSVLIESLAEEFTVLDYTLYDNLIFEE